MTLAFIAHRGNCQHHFENSLASVQAALEAGVFLIEIDVQITKDGILVLFHDRNLSAKAGVNKAVAQCTTSQLAAMTFIDDSKRQSHQQKGLTLLAEVASLIANYPKAKLFVEVKRVNFIYFSYQCVLQKLLAVLTPISKQVVWLSFSYRFLRLAAKKSHLPVAYVLPSWQQYSDKMLRLLTPDYIFCDQDDVPEHFVFPSSPCWALYEFSDLINLADVYQRGLRYCESFYPALLQKQWQQQITQGKFCAL